MNDSHLISASTLTHPNEEPKKLVKKPKAKLIASNRLDFDLDFMWGDKAP